MDDPVKCANPECGAEIEFWQIKCPVCGTPAGYPNVRKAQAEQEALNNFYDAAIVSSNARGANSKVIVLEHQAVAGKIVVNLSVDTVYNMIRNPMLNYVSYYRAVDAGVRKAAKEQHHVDRSVADDALFPNYADHIVYGALSCDGRGVTNYGPIAVSLKDEVAPLRASLLIENSFRFLATHFKPQQPLPQGYRAVWGDRGRLAVVKHATDLSAAMSDSDVNKLILRPGADRNKDDFIEVHLYDGFDKRAVERVFLDAPLIHPHDQNRWRELKELLAFEKVEFDEVGAKP